MLLAFCEMRCSGGGIFISQMTRCRASVYPCELPICKIVRVSLPGVW